MLEKLHNKKLKKENFIIRKIRKIMIEKYWKN